MVKDNYCCYGLLRHIKILNIGKIMKNNNKATLAALGLAALTTSSLANAQSVDFNAQVLSSGYQVASMEGKCGEGTCGADKMKDKAKLKGKELAAKAKEGKCGEGKCGADKMKDKAKLKGKELAAKAKEGKCGEGKCGADKMKDKAKGKSMELKTKGMELKAKSKELKAKGKEMAHKVKEGKCGEGKCGGKK